MKCKNCNSENIIMQEWMWAYDWWMTYKCTDCWQDHHRSWLKVIKAEQEEDYWPVMFELEWWQKARNLKLI